MPTALNITFGGEQLLLNSDRTLWWPKQQILFATDLHAGKTEHMRRYGLAIPGGSLETDLQRLQTAAQRHQAQQLIFLGDLFHSDPNTEWDTFADWCHAQPYTIILVRGNHDRFLSDEMLTQAGLQVFTEPQYLAPFSLRHHPLAEPATNEFVLAGHIHPVVNTVGTAKDQLRLPCFWQQAQQLILPAFGSFTGGHALARATAEHIYACAPDDSAIVAVQ